MALASLPGRMKGPVPLPGPGTALSSPMPCHRLARPSQSANKRCCSSEGSLGPLDSQPGVPHGQTRVSSGWFELLVNGSVLTCQESPLGAVTGAPETGSWPLPPPGSGPSLEAATTWPADLLLRSGCHRWAIVPRKMGC